MSYSSAVSDTRMRGLPEAGTGVGSVGRPGERAATFASKSSPTHFQELCKDEVISVDKSKSMLLEHI